MIFERNKWQTCIQQEGSKESVEKTYGKDDELRECMALKD